VNPLEVTPRVALAAGRRLAQRTHTPDVNPSPILKLRLRRLFWRLQPYRIRLLFLNGFFWQWRRMDGTLPVLSREESL
jgi:hypothetical protein